MANQVCGGHRVAPPTLDGEFSDASRRTKPTETRFLTRIQPVGSFGERLTGWTAEKIKGCVYRDPRFDADCHRLVGNIGSRISAW